MIHYYAYMYLASSYLAAPELPENDNKFHKLTSSEQVCVISTKSILAVKKGATKNLKKAWVKKM